MLARVHKVLLYGLSQSTSTGSDLRPSVNIHHQKQVRANLKAITQSQEPVILALKKTKENIRSRCPYSIQERDLRRPFLLDCLL